MILTIWLYWYNMQFIENGLEGDVDSGGEEDETEDTYGVKVEHLHILVSILLVFTPLGKFDRFCVLNFFVKMLSMLLLYMKVLIYMCTSFVLKQNHWITGKKYN